jgi:hypothetical protein
LGSVAPIERFAEHRFDDGLTTDIQRVCLSVQFPQHRCSEVYIGQMNCRPEEFEPICEVTGVVLPAGGISAIFSAAIG